MSHEERARNADEASANQFTDLVNSALLHAQELVRAEVALAKSELRAELGAVKYACIALAGAALLINAAVLTAAIAVLFAVGLSAPRAFAVAGLFLVLGVAGLLIGRYLLARPHMERTRNRIVRDARVLAHAAEGENR